MKKWFALILSVVMIGTFVPSSLAEDGASEALNSLGSLLSGAWDQVSELAAGALEDASAWVDDNWGDASKWVEQAWNDSSAWAESIWGDVSAWASETYGTASAAAGAWMAETLNNLKGAEADTWAWLQDSSGAMAAQGGELLQKMKDALADPDEDLQKVRSLFEETLKELELSEADIEKVWATVQAYAQQKGLSAQKVTRLILPYLVQLKTEYENGVNGTIPAISIAQYLTAVVEKLGVATEKAADALIAQLNEALGK